MLAMSAALDLTLKNLDDTEENRIERAYKHPPHKWEYLKFGWVCSDDTFEVVSSDLTLWSKVVIFSTLYLDLYQPSPSSFQFGLLDFSCTLKPTKK